MRHGETAWNREHRIQGQSDPPLSDQGRRQAERLGKRLAGRRLAGFYSSDLKRALETAQVIGQAVGVEPKPMPGLREIYLGDWEGLQTVEIAKQHPEAWASWTREPNWDLVPGGEGAERFETRVAAALDAILDSHPHGDVLVVTHGGVIQVALHKIVGLPNQGLFPFRIQNASMSVIEKHNGRFVVGGVNDIGHLEADREGRRERTQ